MAQVVSRVEIKNVFKEHQNSRPSVEVDQDDKGMYVRDKRPCNPDDAPTWMLKIMVSASFGERGYCENNATLAFVTKLCQVRGARKNVLDLTLP